jgi:hypothetical protein
LASKASYLLLKDVVPNTAEKLVEGKNLSVFARKVT